MRKALKRARRTLRTYRDSFGNIVRGSRESLERLAQPEVSDEPRAEANPVPQPLPVVAESFDEKDVKEERTCCQRHFGTDALLGSWFLAAASLLFALYGLALVIESWNSDDATWVTFAWGNLASGVMFMVGSFYFVSVSYPETMDRCAREALTVDVDTLSFVEKHFTFNDMMLATWSFELGCIPYLVVAAAYLAEGGHRNTVLGALLLSATLVGMACLYVWVRSAMPHEMQKNGGNGSSEFYEIFIEPCCGDNAFLRRHLGTDLQAGGWLFFGPTAVAAALALALVCVFPGSLDAWIGFVQMVLLAVGAGLLLRSMYPGAREEAPLLG